MDGFIDKNAVVDQLAKLSATLRHYHAPTTEIHIDTVRDLILQTINKIDNQAHMDLRSATFTALGEVGHNARIPAIKRVRELTGVGLREAKDAVEKYAPAFLADHIEKLSEDLLCLNRVAIEHGAKHVRFGTLTTMQNLAK
jgi:ribosomal protein L7/L12